MVKHDLKTLGKKLKQIKAEGDLEKALRRGTSQLELQSTQDWLRQQQK